MTFDRSKVDGFDVTLGSSTFEVAKKDADWTLVKPIAARADTSASDGLVEQRRVAADEIGGVDSAHRRRSQEVRARQAGVVVNLHLGSARASLAIGGSAGDDTNYAKDLSRPDVYTVQKTAADDFKKVADDYRRKDMFDMRAFTATHIDITRNGKTLGYDKVKGTGENAADTWKRVTPTPADADKEKFQTLRREPGRHSRDQLRRLEGEDRPRLPGDDRRRQVRGRQEGGSRHVREERRRRVRLAS